MTERERELGPMILFSSCNTKHARRNVTSERIAYVVIKSFVSVAHFVPDTSPPCPATTIDIDDTVKDLEGGSREASKFSLFFFRASLIQITIALQSSDLRETNLTPKLRWSSSHS